LSFRRRCSIFSRSHVSKERWLLLGTVWIATDNLTAK
jgi:hypothetical protein